MLPLLCVGLCVYHVLREAGKSVVLGDFFFLFFFFFFFFPVACFVSPGVGLVL